ncbi:hypothetical protein M0805_000436 [Coniferiporia weirii]|nr:hypothetical protein M0805_000436 [Coniferiporia weirii]
MSLECRVYQEELRSLGYGLPLYEPNPSGYDHVRVADVGFAEKETGYFHRIFNALLPADDPINLKYGTPAGFEPLFRECGETRSLNGIKAGSWLHLSHVKRIEGEIDFSSSFAASHANVNFSVSSHQAAALFIKYSAERSDATRLAHYRKYMLKNYRSWLKLLRDDLGFDVNLRDIVFVTGHDLTANWATATFVGSAVHRGAQLTAGSPSTLTASASISGAWESSVSIPIRIGPKPDRTPLPLPQTQEGDETVRGNDPVKDQCIFIRGFRVSERLLVPRVIKAAASPEDLDMDRDSDYATGVVAVDFDSDEGETTDQDISSHDIAFDAIFELTNADIAIVHESDVCKLMKVLKENDKSVDIRTILAGSILAVVTEFEEDLRVEVGTLTGRIDDALMESLWSMPEYTPIQDDDILALIGRQFFPEDDAPSSGTVSENLTPSFDEIGAESLVNTEFSEFDMPFDSDNLWSLPTLSSEGTDFWGLSPDISMPLFQESDAKPNVPPHIGYFIEGEHDMWDDPSDFDCLNGQANCTPESSSLSETFLSSGTSTSVVQGKKRKFEAPHGS